MAESVIKVQNKLTGSITAASGWSFSEAAAYQQGNVCMIKGYASKSSGTIGSSQVIIGTVTGISKPSSNIRTVCGTGTAAYSANHSAYCILSSSDGELSILSSNSSDTNVVFCITYIA